MKRPAGVSLPSALLIAFATAAAALAVDPAREVEGLRDQPGRVWLVWEVPATEQGGQLCCFEGPGDARRCRLGDRGRNWGTSDTRLFPPGAALRIHLALENGEAKRLLAVSSSCPVETQGEQVRRIDGVTTEASVRYLAGLTSPWKRDSSESALAAVAFHEGAAATESLARLARERGGAENRREQAIFWLGAERGAAGLAALRVLLREPVGEELAEHTVFAISQNPGGTEVLLELVQRPDVPRGIRRQALFWLGQSDDPRALEEISRLLAP